MLSSVVARVSLQSHCVCRWIVVEGADCVEGEEGSQQRANSVVRKDGQ